MDEQKKTIIIASDFTSIADDATVYAMEAAKVVGAKVILFHLHVMSVHVANARLSPAALQESLDQNRGVALKKAKELAEQYGLEVDVEWRMGDFYTELRDVIDSRKADLVVMGMAQKSIEQDLMGNTTTAAISRLKFPVLAIPKGAKFEGIKKIMFACDIDRGIHSYVLKQVRAVAMLFDAEVEIFHVSEKLPKIAEKDQLPDHVAKSFGDGLDGIKYLYKNVSSNAVVQEIENEINLTGADLLVMVPYRYGFWGSLVHKSKTRAMASGNTTPLLSIPV